MDLPHFEMKYRNLRPVYKPFLDKYKFSDFIVNCTDEECEQMCEDLREVTFDVNGVRQFESNIVTDIYGMPFVWSWHGSTLTVYDAVGGTTVANGYFQGKGDRRKVINEVVNRMEEFTQGYTHCSDCGTRIKYHGEVAGRYFAGVYCEKCWDGKWKAIEAKETYN
jgi:hypothetical protein